MLLFLRSINWQQDIFIISCEEKTAEQAHAYLTGRGLSEETIKKFGLGYSDKYSDDLYKYLKVKELQR